MIRILESKQVGRLLARKAARLTEAEAVVRPILEAVRQRGDRALLEYARQFDGLDAQERARAGARTRRRARACSRRNSVPPSKSPPPTSAPTPSARCRANGPRKRSPGLQLGQIVRPLDTVAAYIPAGRYPLPSTLMMTVVPAQVAGVPQHLRRLAREPVDRSLRHRRPAGRRATSFEMGGAQAIAAFAFGTRTVPRADRIVGPGNIYVAAAKKLLAGEVGIDFVAGPTEILIIAADGDPRHLAADMLAQAEHDVDASRHPAHHLEAPRRRPWPRKSNASSPRCPPPPWPAKAIAQQYRHRPGALARRSRRRSPTASRPSISAFPTPRCFPAVRHAGSVFVGPFSPEAAGDYASGPNHVLPTSGAARMRGGLSVTDYVKVISVQELERSRALRNLAPAITTLARAEGLEAHARSVEVTGRDRGRSASQRRQSSPAQPSSKWRPIRRPPPAAPANCASISTRTPWAARRASSTPPRRPRPPTASPSIPNTAKPKQAIAAYFHVAARAVRLHQRHRRSHPGLHQHLRG